MRLTIYHPTALASTATPGLLSATPHHTLPRVVFARIVLEIHRVVGAVSVLRVERRVTATTIIRRVKVGTVKLGLLQSLVDLIMQEAKPKAEET